MRELSPGENLNEESFHGRKFSIRRGGVDLQKKFTQGEFHHDLKTNLKLDIKHVF